MSSALRDNLPKVWKRIPDLGKNRVVRTVLSDRELMVYGGFLLLIVFLGIFGETIAPYDYEATQYAADGTLLRAAPPSIEHPLGTTDTGQDVLSRIIIGARPTVVTGIVGGTLIITLGTLIGVTSGFFGGWIGNILMRLTDFVYGVPLIPFAIVLLAMLGFGLYTSILAIGFILWRGSARVLRSQVLQIKQRPFITAARATGMSSTMIIRRHILPNIAPMILLFFSLGIGYSIVTQAGLAFIGVSNPFLPSWGVMIRNAYTSGYADVAWWWSVPPGVLISLTVLSAFMFGRKYEEISGGSEPGEDVFVQGG